MATSRLGKLHFHRVFLPQHRHRVYKTSAIPCRTHSKAYCQNRLRLVTPVRNKQDSNEIQSVECDMGPLFPNKVRTGLRTRVVEDKLRGIAWSDQDIRVSRLDDARQIDKL